ncbi:hypothetical protein J4427_02170 [Candidatus Woesearchaeota archaeon]|nr:hypothetical protein [Candidatus Woesearchaeota archaeon]
MKNWLKEDKPKKWEKTAILFGIIIICVAISKIFSMDYILFLMVTIYLAIFTFVCILSILRNKIKGVDKIPERYNKYIRFLKITFFLTFFVTILLINLYGFITFNFGFNRETTSFLTLQILSLLGLITILIIYLYLYFSAGINIKKMGFVKIKNVNLLDIYPLVLIITFFITFEIAEILEVFLGFKNLYSWVVWIFILLYLYLKFKR